MKHQSIVLENEKEVLTFLKSRFPFYHLSNFFFRDLQYGIQWYLKEKKMKVGYVEAEAIARAFVAQLEKKKIFNRIDGQSWAVNYPEFKTPVTKAPAPAPAPKPAAASAPAAPQPA